MQNFTILCITPFLMPRVIEDVTYHGKGDYWNGKAANYEEAVENARKAFPSAVSFYQEN